LPCGFDLITVPNAFGDNTNADLVSVPDPGGGLPGATLVNRAINAQLFTI